MTNLFQTGDFTLSSGLTSNFKIECDSLTDADIATLAGMIAKRYTYHAVTGVPRGGLRIAEAVLAAHPAYDYGRNHLIVDDVYTTGDSMTRVREHILRTDPHPNLVIFGIVLFARAPISKRDSWITSIFQIQPGFYR